MIEILHHMVAGQSNPQAPWLFFLHGLMGSLANWRRISPAFEDHFRVVTVDQRGHGKSFKPQSGYAPQDFAGDIKRLFDHLGVEKAYMVGHSMGGRNAMHFANIYPQMVEKLVIEDIGPSALETVGRGLAAKLQSIPVPFETKMKAKEYLMNDYGDPKMGSFLYTLIALNDAKQAVWSVPMDAMVEVILKGRSTARWEEVQGIKCPTLVVRGENSDELPVDEFERMLRENSLIKGLEIAGAGHWVHHDKPIQYISALKDFFGI